MKIKICIAYGALISCLNASHLASTLKDEGDDMVPLSNPAGCLQKIVNYRIAELYQDHEAITGLKVLSLANSDAQEDEHPLVAIMRLFIPTQRTLAVLGHYLANEAEDRNTLGSDEESDKKVSGGSDGT